MNIMRTLVAAVTLAACSPSIEAPKSPVYREVTPSPVAKEIANKIRDIRETFMLTCALHDVEVRKDLRACSNEENPGVSCYNLGYADELRNNVGIQIIREIDRNPNALGDLAKKRKAIASARGATDTSDWRCLRDGLGSDMLERQLGVARPGFSFKLQDGTECREKSTYNGEGDGYTLICTQKVT